MAFEISYFAFLFPVLLAALAVYFFSGRGSFLISGYNTLPKEERERYNVRALTRATGIFSGVLAVLMFLTLFAGLVLENSVWALAGIICIAGWTVIGLVYMNTSKKMKQRPY